MGGSILAGRDRMDLNDKMRLRLLPALGVLQARREAEELAQEDRERALCANACLLARALETPEGLRALRTSRRSGGPTVRAFTRQGGSRKVGFSGWGPCFGGGGTRFHLCLRRITGRAVGDWPRERQDGARAGVRDRPCSRRGGSLGTEGRGARFLARFRRGAGNGGILPQTAGVCNGEMRLRAACLPLQKNCASFPKND